jgi:hypothetical protein
MVHRFENSGKLKIRFGMKIELIYHDRIEWGFFQGVSIKKILESQISNISTVLPRIQLSEYYSNSSAKVTKFFGLGNILN